MKPRVFNDNVSTDHSNACSLGLVKPSENPRRREDITSQRRVVPHRNTETGAHGIVDATRDRN